MKFYTFVPFGYTGVLVNAEVYSEPDRTGCTVCGVRDADAGTLLKRTEIALKGAGLDFPQGRILMAFTPCDTAKDILYLEFAAALAAAGVSEDWGDRSVLVLSHFDMDGSLRPTEGAVVAVQRALMSGITDVVCDKETARLLRRKTGGIRILAVSSLREAADGIKAGKFRRAAEKRIAVNDTVEFDEELWSGDRIRDEPDFSGLYASCRAIEIAVAGKLHIIQTGIRGCGKTLLQKTLIPALTPRLTAEERDENDRIYSMSGYDLYGTDTDTAPFRQPHQTASIEGICGGGTRIRPGEVTLANNGTLFLDDAMEFRSSVLTGLVSMMDTGHICISRAGRSSIYPAHFRLALTAEPCPCGGMLNESRICLCTNRVLRTYWRKLYSALYERIHIKNIVRKDEADERKITAAEMRAHVAKAYEIQRARGAFNSEVNLTYLTECLDQESGLFADKIQPNRERWNTIRAAVTIANMDGRKCVTIDDITEAYEYTKPFSFIPTEEE